MFRGRDSDMKTPGWWTNKVFLVLAISAFLVICNGGYLYNYVVWGFYLASGWKVVKAHPSEENKSEFAGQVLLGIVVCVVGTIIAIAAMLKY